MAGIECGKFDVSALGQDEYVISTDEKLLWLRAEVEEKIVIKDGAPYVILKFANKLETGFCPDVNNLNWRIGHLTEALELGTQSDPDGEVNDEHKAEGLKLTTAQKTQVEDQQKGVGASDINMLGLVKPAVMPAAAVIPMRSNIFVYGPFVTSNFTSSTGGTSIQTNPEICPWVFGSMSDMSAAGQSLVDSVALGLIKAETGSVTLAGLPDPSLSKLGAQVAGAGPNLSSISFSFGSNGVTTNYQFATYTPKFGSLTNSQLETMKSVSKNRQAQLKFLRSQAITQNKISRQLSRNSARDARIARNARANKPANQMNTVQRILVGEMYGFRLGGQEGDPIPTRTAVVMTDLVKTSPEMYYDYGKKAYFSLDGIFSPVSYNGANGNLPRLANFPKSGEGNVWYGASVAYRASGAPQSIQPPFTKNSSSSPTYYEHDQYNLNIDSRYEKAMTNKASMEFHYHNNPGSGAGHNIEFVGRETGVPQKGISTNKYSPDAEGRYSNDYRFLSLKGPLMLHSWGFDTNGKPIPNYVDTTNNASIGVFQASGVKNKFLDNWLQNPKTWPVAPVDLRFDRQRGVWVSPPPYKIVAARLTEAISAYGSGEGVIINTRGSGDNPTKYDAPLFDNDGNLVVSDEDTSGAYIKVVDRLGASFSEGSNVYVYYDTFNSEYLILDSIQSATIITGRASGEYSDFYSTAQKAEMGQYYYPAKAFGPDTYGDDTTYNPIRIYPVFTTYPEEELKYLSDKPVSFSSVAKELGVSDGGTYSKVRNPLGFAASSGDFVTLQRVDYLEDGFLGNIGPAWIVISVGRGPYLTQYCGEYPGAGTPMPPSSYP